MSLTILPRYSAQTLRRYEENMARYPKKREEVEAFLQGRDETFSLCLRFLYGHLTVMDMVSFPVELLADYVSATLAVYEKLEYVKTIPQDIFLSYVLHHRVNSECLDGSRMALMAEILPYVQGKTMREAALAVNYWCYSKATYTPADDRTLGPLAVMRRTLGRCGEESVLAVAALRSVGIPARQCYCPRWSHCDDNHAWVEVWVDGAWHYLGACEPEPVLDKGWFTAAASRAMLVHTKRWSDIGEDENVLSCTPLYAEVNCTGVYADTRTLTVRLLDNGAPAQGREVAFQIINYSEFFTLHRALTDENGLALFETGLGDLCVTVCHGGKMLLKKVDARTQKDVLVLDLTDGWDMEQLPEQVKMDLVPPAENCLVPAQAEDLSHASKLQDCDVVRANYLASFPQPEGNSVSENALREAAGNWQQIRAFLADERYPLEKKEELLATLRAKDFADITCETLLDALDTAEKARGQFPADVFQAYILAPRIADEMLLPERRLIRSLFPEGFADPEEILHWMWQNMQIAQDHGVNNFYPSAYGCLAHRQVPAFAFDMVFVALCRAFRFPARLAPDTKEGQWLDPAGAWHGIWNNAADAAVTLVLRNATGERMHYFEHFSVGYWDGREFQSLQYWDLSLEEACQLQVKPGLYRIVLTTRQIDGTASVLLRHIWVNGDAEIFLELPADQTQQRLKQVPLEIPVGPVRDAMEETAGQRRIFIFAEPGAEPTEHLLQELLQCAAQFREENCQIRIFVEQEAALENATLRQVNTALETVQTHLCRDPQAEAALHRAMQVGDLRRPFVIALDEMGRGVYACANYHIRMAQTLLKIQKLIRSSD